MPTNDSATLPVDRDLSVSRLIATLAVIGAGILLGGVLGTVLLGVVPESGTWASLIGAVTRFLSPDGERNLWAWFSTLLLAGLAFVLLTTAVLLRTTGRNYGVFVLLAGVASFMCLDEAVSLHEKLAGLIPDSSSTFAWLIVGIPAAVAVGVVVLLATRFMNRTLRRRLIVAGVVFLSGAVATEALQAVSLALLDTDGGDTTPASAIGTGIEEGLELAGTLLALRAVLMAMHIRLGAGGLLMSVPEPVAGHTTAAVPVTERVRRP